MCRTATGQRSPPPHPTTFAFYLLPFAFFSPHLPPGAVSRRYKSQCAMTLAVLDARFYQWGKSGKK